MIAANTTLTFAVDGQVSLSWTDWQRKPEDLRSIVIDQLTPYLGVGVVNVQPLNSGLLDWTYSALVTVTTKTAYATVDDVASIVAHAFYVGGNNLPTVQATAKTADQIPGGIGDYGLTKDITDAANKIVPKVGETFKSISDALGEFLKGLGTTIDIALVGVAVVVVVVGVVYLKSESK